MGIRIAALIDSVERETFMEASSKRSSRRESALLEALANGLSVAAAAQRAGIGRRTAFRWKSQDPHFCDRWSEAVEAGTDRLEDEALRRAVEGVEEPVYQGGRQVGVVRKYDSQLIMFLLKARRPSKYRERATIQHSGAEDAHTANSGAGERILRRLDQIAESYFASAQLRLVEIVPGGPGEPPKENCE